MTLTDDVAKPPFPAGLDAKLAKIGEVPDTTALEARIQTVAASVAAIYQNIIDQPADSARIKFGNELPH